MRHRWSASVAIGAALLVGLAFVVASVVVPIALLLHLDDEELARWSQIGQALEPVGIFFSGVAFIGITITLLLQRRELQNQREELAVTRDEQQWTSETMLRQLHVEIVKMAIDDPELRDVWPPLALGDVETKKDHYVNLILNLQKLAYEAHTIELAELRGALRYLMTSPDVYHFWRRARNARGDVTAGDEAEDFFTAEVDKAFANASPPEPTRLVTLIRQALAEWRIRSR